MQANGLRPTRTLRPKSERYMRVHMYVYIYIYGGHILRTLRPAQKAPILLQWGPGFPETPTSFN